MKQYNLEKWVKNTLIYFDDDRIDDDDDEDDDNDYGD